MINLNYEYKLRLTKEQIAKVDLFLEGCRKVYNYALRERKDWLNSRKSPVNSCSLHSEYILPADEPFPNYNVQAKRLTQYRKTSEELSPIHSQVLQQTLKTLDKAFEDMRKKNFGFPRFKKKMRSFIFPQLKIDCLGYSRIKLPSFGWVKIIQSRPFPEQFIPKQCRIVRYFNRTGKKKLSERIHRCPHCRYQENRDVVSAIILQQRGERAFGLRVRQIAFGGDVTGGV